MNVGQVGSIARDPPAESIPTDQTFDSKILEELPAPARIFSRIERLGLTGCWRWQFNTGDMLWSPGLYRLLGIEPNRLQPSYDLLLGLIHPEDRPRLETVGQVLRGEILAIRRFRVVHPDGSVHDLTARSEVEWRADGRPVAVTSRVVDASDPNVLIRALETERRLRSTMYARRGAYLFTVRPDLTFDYMPEAGRDRGLRIEEFNEDPFRFLVAGERERLLGKAAEHRFSGRIFQETTLRRRLDGQIEHHRILVIPTRTDAGLFGGTGVSYPAADRAFSLPVEVRGGLYRAVQGCHLRAARALLDCSMTVLAEASGVSLSTIRRIEEDAPHRSERSTHRVIEALRDHGIRFTVLDDGTIAVSKR